MHGSGNGYQAVLLTALHQTKDTRAVRLLLEALEKRLRISVAVQARRMADHGPTWYMNWRETRATPLLMVV